MTYLENSDLLTDYESVVRDFHGEAISCRQPINGTFELTERCNLACQMCYIRKPSGDRVCRSKELATKEWIELAHQARDNGMIFLLLTGGEVFLRADFFELYTRLTNLGLIITIFSNGTIISDSIAKRLADSPPSRIAITLYGASDLTYEVVTGNSKGFEHCCKGIEALYKYGIPIELRAIITKDNFHEIDAIQNLAKNWGLNVSMASLLTKRRDGELSDVVNCRLSAADCVIVESIDINSATTRIKKIDRKRLPFNGKNFDCSAGKASFVINSQGEMNACIDLPLPAARPLEIGFSEAWKQLQHFIDSSPPVSPICDFCSLASYCSRCPAWSYLETGTLIGPVPYLCDIAFERKKHYE